MKILTGMSGGVDSSVAAAMLKEAGHEVIGATMAIWGDKGVHKKLKEQAEKAGRKSTHGACYGPDEKEDIEAAREVCKQLDIPFYVFDCAEQYEKIVLENFKHEYLAGRTPNPCVLCNALIKFGVLPELARMNGIEFDKFATGHYAKIEQDENGRYLLKQGISPKKDQSYFLYRLKPEQLENIILPLGDRTKEEIRDYALKHGLKVAQKPDSQDFYEGDYNELLEVKPKAGNIVDKEGNILGTHEGIWNYTIGQRKGIGIAAKEALYVTELRKDTNEVVVGFKDDTMTDEIFAYDLNKIVEEKFETPFECSAKIRSSQAPEPVTVTPCEDGRLKIKFENMQKSIAQGQSIVFYDKNVVLGGGIMQKA